MACLTKTIQGKLYPNQETKATLETIFRGCQLVYNHCLKWRIVNHKTKQNQPSKYEQKRALVQLKKDNPWLKDIQSQILTDIPWRQIPAIWTNHISYRKTNPKASYPRIKTDKGWYSSFTYPQQKVGNTKNSWVFKIEGNCLKIKQGAKVKKSERELKIPLELNQIIQGEIKTLNISRKNNVYHANFACEVEAKPQMSISQVKRQVGIDRGVINLLATSEGWKYANPRFFKKGAERLTKLYQAMSRKKHKRFKDDNTKNSKNFEQAKLKLAQEFKKISNRMKDRNHKLSRKLVNVFDLIAYEDLKLKKMSEKKPNQKDQSLRQSKRKINKYTVKSLQQASLRMLGDFTTYKVQETGKWIVFVDPRNTSQTCSKCHQKSLIKQKLNDRIFICAFCKNELDRDINSAKNILYKAQTELGTLSSERI